MPATRLLSYLPAIFGEDPFLGEFLAPFERMLLGPTNDGSSLSEIIARIATYFDPQATPAEFLDWLSGWVALNLRADLDEAHRRNFLSSAVQLYRLRGTKAGLQQFLQIYTGLAPTITEFEGDGFQIGAHSTVGVDTFLGGGGPHYFRVVIRIDQSDPALRDKYLRIATAIIDAEKPAHTAYDLYVETPAMQIGVHSTVGVDTVLGVQI
jgi:phage tail-like protein